MYMGFRSVGKVGRKGRKEASNTRLYDVERLVGKCGIQNPSNSNFKGGLTFILLVAGVLVYN